MAGLTREVAQKEGDMKTLLTEEDFMTLKRCEKQEEEYAKRKLREHYQGRRMWIRKKTREQLVETLPKEIDGVSMEDQELDERFNASVKQYGGVSLDDDEKEALKLQPNFAVFDEIDDLNFMANTEKTFNALRWSEAFRRNRETEEEGIAEGEVINEGENQDTFYNEETKTFDATKVKHHDIPFRKRVGVPECAEPMTEAKLTLCRDGLNRALEKYKET